MSSLSRTRKILALGIAVVTAVGLAGCATGGAGGSGQSSTLNPDAKVSGQITVWSWDVAATALKRLGTQYQKAHPGTTIKVVDVGYDNVYDKISVGLQAGSGLPDVLTIETDHTPGYISQFSKGFTDLDSILGSDKSDFDPSKWAASVGKNGDLYAAPWDAGTMALYYRSDYLKAADINPASLTSWNALVTAGEKIKSQTGHTLMSTDLSAGGPFYAMLQQQGQGIFDAQGKIDITSPAAVNALTLIKKMNDKGLLKNVKGWDAEVTSAKNGDSAVDPNAVWWIGTLTSEMPELSGKFGVTELPAFTGGGARTSNNGGSGLAIPTQAKNPQLAASFVKYVLANKDNQVSMMKKEGLFPSYLPALKNSYFQQPQPFFGGQKVYQQFADLTAKIPPITYTSDNSAATDVINNAVAAAVLNGADPTKALTDAAKQIATATGRSIAG